MATAQLGLKIRMPSAAEITTTRVEDSTAAPLRSEVESTIRNKAVGSIVQTFNTWSNDRGQRGVKPRTRFNVEPGFIRIELTVELMDGTAALIWFNDAFDLGNFRATLDVAMANAIDKWASGQFGYECVADENAIVSR